MKKYQHLYLIGDNNPDAFLDQLNESIINFQKQGYEVEVQYSAVAHTMTALLLMYTNE